MTQVVHIRDSKNSEEYVYIGRPGKGKSSIFGNPIVCGRTCSVCKQVHEAKASTLPCYQIYLRSRLIYDGAFHGEFWKLKGKRLVCFCAPPGGFAQNAEPVCHGQIMASILDSEHPLQSATALEILSSPAN